jgi:hypothetical protein
VKRFALLLVTVSFATSLFGAIDHTKEGPVVRVTAKPTGRAVVSVPTVELYSDGFVSIHNYDGTKRTKMVGPKRVSALLVKFEKLGFYRVTARTVEASIEKAAYARIRTTRAGTAEVKKIVITDCDISTISVRHGAKTHSITFYAVGEMAEEYPKATDLIILRKAITAVYDTVNAKS